MRFSTARQISIAHWSRIAGPARLAALFMGLTIVHAPAQSKVDLQAPRLVVLIVIDQFRYDYLQRFDKHFSDGGFNRILREGASFTQARYRHATSDTCPGHAVISTGTWGNVNGIVANQWFDTELGQRVGCADALGREPAGTLLRPTIGDVLKEAGSQNSKVISMSGKRAAAILLSAREADATYWPDAKGQFVSWSPNAGRLARFPEMLDPRRRQDWAMDFNDAGHVASYFDRAWERVLPAETYDHLGPDDEPAERKTRGFGRTFPHSMTSGHTSIRTDFHSAFRRSPFEDEVLAKFAMTAVREEALGQDDITDLLAISFSSSDRVGHGFGPDSHEMMDMVVRTDRLLARLLAFLDDEVGLEHTIVVVTADHGVAPLPERERRRTGEADPGRILELLLVEAADRALEEAYGKPESGSWVAFHDFPNLYLDEAAVRSRDIRISDAEEVVRRALEDFPGVRRAFTRTRLAELQGEADLPEPVRAALLSFHPSRSGHVVYQVAPYNVVARTGTNHGSHWDYDTHVPLMWLGPGVKPGRYASGASPADIAPTVLALLGIAPDPEQAGRVLAEMLD